MFYVIAREREDGDYDSIAAFSADGVISLEKKVVGKFLKYLNNTYLIDSFVVFKLQNVDEIIDGSLVGLGSVVNTQTLK